MPYIGNVLYGIIQFIVRYYIFIFPIYSYLFIRLCIISCSVGIGLVSTYGCNSHQWWYKIQVSGVSAMGQSYTHTIIYYLSIRIVQGWSKCSTIVEEQKTRRTLNQLYSMDYLDHIGINLGGIGNIGYILVILGTYSIILSSLESHRSTRYLFIRSYQFHI